MDSELEEKVFKFGMYWRIGYGVLRVLVGLAVLKAVGTPVLDAVATLMSYEIVEDPNDALFILTGHIFTNHPLYISYFVPVYFMFWGVVDIVLSYNLIKHRMWAFPASFIVIGLFILYEMVRFTHTHSSVLLWMILVDIFILGIIWREYKKLKT